MKRTTTQSTKRSLADIDSSTDSENEIPREVKVLLKEQARKSESAVKTKGVKEVEVEQTKTRRPRHVPTKESVMDDFNEISVLIEEEITRLKETRDNTTMVKEVTKFLRGMNKQVKNLSKHTARIMKQKTTSTRKKNNSGFEKPVKISSELAKFCQWSEDELKSRVDVTKYICNYIAENNLQNPKDRRQIQPDNKLRRLLGYNPKAQDVLKYYNIQTCLKDQNHFPK